MKIKDIEFKFKGSRSYIHGTDLFNAMIPVNLSVDVLNLRFSIHDFVYSPICQIYLTDNKETLNNLPHIHARCQYDMEGITHFLALTQIGNDASLGARYKYDEEEILSLCCMEAEGIALIQHSPFTFIENVVAMNKHMHKQLFPDAVGKWIFTRIDLMRGCDEQESIALHLKHNMNYRLTKTDIHINGVKVGDIYFSLVNS